MLEPLANAELESQAEDKKDKLTDNAAAHDLVLAYNNLGVLMTDKNELAKAEQLSETAIRIQKALSQRDPENLRYRQELAIFQNNLAFLAYQKGDMEIAKQQNHEALDGIEELATPIPKMEIARAKAHMFYSLAGSSSAHRNSMCYTRDWATNTCS